MLMYSLLVDNPDLPELVQVNPDNSLSERVNL